MAIKTAREPKRVAELLARPWEAISARLSGLLNQERWTLLITTIALVLANLVILGLILQGQENRAIAFAVLVMIIPIALLVPEISVVVFICLGAGLFGNAFYFAVGPGGGTGIRVLTLLLLAILSVRAIYEYLQTPKSERPRLFNWIILGILMYWVYHMAHVIYIYLFQYHQLPPGSEEVALGFYRAGLFRYLDYHMFWIGILPLIVLLRDYQRAKRVFVLLGFVMMVGAGSILWEYFAPLPIFFKILFQLQAAGIDASTGDYRIRDPAALYLFMIGFFFALYSLGYLRGWRNNAIVLAFIAATAYAILITQNRILWGGILLVLPIATLWKPPHALMRQLAIVSIAGLFLLAGLLSPRINQIATRIYQTTTERWSRNYAFGGDPRLDPSFQAREREREAWEWSMRNRTTFQTLFGSGLESTYGRYISLHELGLQNPRFRNIYIEKAHMHFAWLKRLTDIGIIGTALLALTLIIFFVRSLVVFYQVRDSMARAMIVGVVGATVGVLAYDSLHTLLHRSEALPVILMWSLVEIIPHWKRTGQIDNEPDPQESPTA